MTKKYPRSKNLNALVPEFKSILDAVMVECPWMQIWEAGRSMERQQYLFDKGGVTNAKPGQSPHNFYAAADCVLNPKHVLLPSRIHKGKKYPSLWDITEESSRALWFLFGQTAERHGLVWGGRFSPMNEFGLGFDPPHVELADWKKLR